MELLKEWTTCVCITVLIAVVFSVFTPSGRMGNFYKMIISLFVFISFIYPLKNANLDFKDYDFKISENYVEENENKAVSNMINSQVKSILNQNNIENCSVITNINRYGDEVEVERVSIAIGGEYDTNEVKKIIFDNLGINAEVHSIGN